MPIHKINLRERTIQFRSGLVSVAIDRNLFSTLFSYFALSIDIQIRNLFYRMFFIRKSFSCYFKPQKPLPPYLIWNILKYAGGKFVSVPEKSNLHIMFSDATVSKSCMNFNGITAINQNCKDIRKQYVQKVFAETFGYTLEINPYTFHGKCVEKSDENGLHIGHIIQCPIKKLKEGMVYQRLVNNEDTAGNVIDYRCTVIKNSIPLVYIKKRPKNIRFLNKNTSVKLANTNNIFSKAEQKYIQKFVKKMQLDFGELDILRDRKTNKIFIVDVNTTPLGPPVALKYSDKILAIRILSECFTKEFIEII